MRSISSYHWREILHNAAVSRMASLKDAKALCWLLWAVSLPLFLVVACILIVASPVYWLARTFAPPKLEEWIVRLSEW